MLVPCKECGAGVERVKRVPALCFKCKKLKRAANAKKHMKKRN